MNGISSAKPAPGAPPLQLFNCTHADCGATFTRQWRLNEHQTVHTGQRLYQCAAAECGRRFKRKSHLSRHMLQHKGVKQFTCKFANCLKSFFSAGNLKRHIRFTHGDKNKYFKCTQPKCPLTFKKRRQYKLHLTTHNVSPRFCCSKDGCAATFESHVARKAHEKTHAGYRCPRADCQAFERTWGRLQKHLASKHPATFTCKQCQKEFKKADALRRHKRLHASHKPVLVCPRQDCKVYFSTTFNLQHHIRKVHLKLEKYSCPFPECTRAFAMRESMNRHLLRHDPNVTVTKKRRHSKKLWQRRLDGHHLPLVEENLRNLFATRMRISRRTKVETDLSGLFNERKIPHYVDPEVNLRDLFSIKPLRPKPAVAPVQG
ncbi:P43 5S RNA-binding protein-like [Eucyclogobius newberryi]|uniref:P43 5S RNA-binding protein-like n=1 Tax=Eucyclogobius newberryi TaxID=166745 RepID=UPI003B5C4801